MVSADVVINDSNTFEQIPSSYNSQLEGLSSSWQGLSHDSFLNKSSEFISEMQKVNNQIISFANAAKVFEKYKELKNDYDNNLNTYNNQVRFSNDSSLVNQYINYFHECERGMAEYASQINSYLADASSFKMEAVVLNNSSTTSATASSNESTTGVGEFVPDNTRGLYGHVVSSLDGLEHDIYKQSQIKGWSRDCNRAAASSIASAYESYDGEAVEVAKKSANGIGYNDDVSNRYFNQFGLNANVSRVNGSYDSIKNDIISNVSNGNFVMFDLAKPNVVGQSGQRWSYTRHWLSVLDIKKTGTGDNDYAIFVSDSGHGGSTVDHGLGAGWYNIDEFTGQKVDNFTTISRT